MNDDMEYDDLLIAEKKAKRIKKQNNYRIIGHDRCETCKNFVLGAGQDYDDECILLGDGKWLVRGISSNGLCDKYEEVTP